MWDYLTAHYAVSTLAVHVTVWLPMVVYMLFGGLHLFLDLGHTPASLYKYKIQRQELDIKMLVPLFANLLLNWVSINSWHFSSSDLFGLPFHLVGLALRRHERLFRSIF
jgi:hypothetical protein